MNDYVGRSGTRQESNTEVLGQNFNLSPGADENGETRVSALRFSQDYTKRILQDVFALRSQFNIGLDILDSSINWTLDKTTESSPSKIWLKK